MTSIVAAQVGSGTVPFVRGILPASQRGNQSNGEGVRTGMQVMVGNPEDLNSVDTFAVSGISIGATPVQIWGPEMNSLPRQREVTIHNQGPGSIYIGPNSTSVISPSGFHIHPPESTARINTLTQITLPLLHNVSVWARADGAGASITILAI